MKDSSSLIERVNEMLGAETFLAIEQLRQSSSLLTLVGRTHTELWHSAVVAWLLNPDSNHSLGFFPLKRFLSAASICGIGREEVTGLPELQEIDAADFCEHAIMPNAMSDEYDGERAVKVDTGKCWFDVAMTAMYSLKNSGNRRKLLLIIENKMKANEGADQTQRYAKWAWETPEYPITGGSENDSGGGKINCRVLVYLTPWSEGKRAAPKDLRFIPMSYQKFHDLVLAPCLGHPKISSRGQLLLREYIDTLVDSEYVLSEREREYARLLDEKYMNTINEMVAAVAYASRAKGLDTSVKNKGTPRVKLGDLCCEGLLQDGQELVYTRRKLNRQTKVVFKEPGVACLRVDGEEEDFATPSGAATRILGDSGCQGWKFFRILDGEWKGKTLDDVREEYTSRSVKEPEKLSHIDQVCADYVDSVFDKHLDAFLFIQRLMREVRKYSEFSLPLRFSRKPHSWHDYKSLLKVLPQKNGVVKAYFKGHSNKVYSVDLSQAPTIIIDEKPYSGLQATRIMAKRMDQDNKSDAYQWSTYWFVAAKGKYKGKSFLEVFRDLSGG